MLAKVLIDAFDEPVAGYEELMNGLMTLLDITDKKGSNQVETPDSFKLF